MHAHLLVVLLSLRLLALVQAAPNWSCSQLELLSTEGTRDWLFLRRDASAVFAATPPALPARHGTHGQNERQCASCE